MELVDLLNIPSVQLFPEVLLPFLIIFAITWGIISVLRVFNRRINLILSLALSVLVIFTPHFTLFANYIAQLGAQVALVAFGILFSFGVLMWMFGRGRDIFEEQIGTSKKVERLMKKRREYLKKAREADDRGDKRKAKDYLKKAKEIEDEMKLAER